MYLSNYEFLTPYLGMLRVDPGHSNYPGIYYDPGQTRSIPTHIIKIKSGFRSGGFMC